MHKWTWTQSSPPFTTNLAAPRRISHVPKIKYLQTYFVFISRFISRSVGLYLSACRRAHASVCMHFIRAACWDGELNSKSIWSAKHSGANTHTQKKKWNTNTHVNTHTGLHTASKSFPSQKLFLGAAANPFFPWYNLFYSYPRRHACTHTYTGRRVHTLLKATLPGGHTAFTRCSLFCFFLFFYYYYYFIFQNRICSR